LLCPDGFMGWLREAFCMGFDVEAEWETETVKWIRLEHFK